ncbi:Cna B-type domain-containing protein [Bifidobacterium cuniculi]|uniref:Collagen adhesin n=1 Tax=Bifidobacterium cuniculi TaxID=1688 RepID=A0A087AWP4_9BIFI|nr:Cna B-type domain-containing protein [Bifidobacterium cuniculi]KFI63194.1 collagen adhesin [Bifidobacterium cuniculi]
MLADGKVTPVGAFADTARFPISWPTHASEEEYRELAATLADLIAANGTPAEATAVTDADGRASFAGLGEGLFLVTADRVDTSTLTCGASAMLVELPNAYAAAGADRMVADIEPKSDCAPPTTATSALQVHKVWQDGFAADRPTSIQVALLRDGAVDQVVELSASNRWTHEWTQLAAGHDWRVVERQVPVGYTMDSDHDTSGDGTEVVTITNSKPFTAGETPAQTGATTVLAVGVAVVAVVLGVLMIMRASAAGEQDEGRRA